MTKLNPYFYPKKRELNKHFSIQGENKSNDNERKLMKSLQSEMIQIYGYKGVYILKTDNTLDKIYGESIGTLYKESFEIEMMAPNSIIDIKETIANFGMSFASTTTIEVAYDRINEEISRLGIEGRDVPLPGDLIWFKVPNILLEIKYVQEKNIAFALGTPTIYTLDCQLFDLSNNENFDTGHDEIDVLNKFNTIVDNPLHKNSTFNDETTEIVVEEPNTWNLEFGKGLQKGKQK